MPQQPVTPVPEKPCFIKQIPPGHYLGISAECTQLAKAQEDSLQNLTKQILQQIGAEYQLEFEKLIYSKNYQTDVTVNDKFSFSSYGILPDIEVKSYFYEKVNNRYVFHALAYFPRSKIIQARKLIEQEQNKRLAKYNSFIRKGKATESNGKIIDALHHYRMAIKQAEVFFKEREIKKATANSYIENLLSRIKLKPISNYNQRGDDRLRNLNLIGGVIFINLAAIHQNSLKVQIVILMRCKKQIFPMGVTFTSIKYW